MDGARRIPVSKLHEVCDREEIVEPERSLVISILVALDADFLGELARAARKD